MVVAVPVKPFDAAKQRLASVLDPATRRTLSIGLAAHTLAAVVDGGAEPLVLSADIEVTKWANEQGLPVLIDPGSSLNRAAAGAVEWAVRRGMAWAICHADLPLVGPSDIATAVESIGNAVATIAHSSDGGTSLIGTHRSDFDFSYGPGSFHRHLARLGDGKISVLSRLGLGLDLDHPSDLEACLSLPQGAWLKPVLEVASGP